MSIEEIEKTIIEKFKNSCEIIIKEDLKDHEFEFVKRLITNFLEYLSEKRRTKNYL